MSALSVAARFARKWIGIALALRRKHDAEIDAVVEIIAAVKGENAKVQRFLKALDEIERTQGANTEFWSKMKAIHESGSPQLVFPEEAAYAMAFKKVWDKFWADEKKNAESLPDTADLDVPAATAPRSRRR